MADAYRICTHWQNNGSGVRMISRSRAVSRVFFFSSRRRHTRFDCDWSSDVCSSDLEDLPMERLGERDVVADPTLTVGTVSKVLAGLVQVDGYGAPGSSGSPMFDRAGRVAAVLYGGEPNSAGEIIYAVAAPMVGDDLRRLR